MKPTKNRKNNKMKNQIENLARQGKFEEALELYKSHPDCVNREITIGHFAQIMRTAIASSDRESQRIASMKKAMNW
jgi:predicted Zn-dependent protease